MLQDEPLEYIKEQFDEKNMVLRNFGEQVSPWAMYEDIFDDLETVLPVVIITEDESEKVGKSIIPMPLEEAIERAADRNDMLLGGCTYFNNWISKKSAKDICTFIIDMDNVYSGPLQKALQDDWATASGDPLPMPTYIVNSGTGLHLYFVLSEPIPNYKATTADLDRVYRALAIQQTTRRVYLKKQVQWFGQDFRIAGGLNKYDWENTVFRVGEKWDIDDLAKAVGVDDVHFTRYGEKRQKKPQQSRQRKKGQGWRTNRAFYDYTLRNCQDKTKEGNRYTSMCALSVIAWKCGVPITELERDLLGLLPGYNKGAIRKVKEKEVYSAMKMYNDKAMLTQRESLENWQGWEFDPIPRNGRRRAEHLQANFWKNEKGRPVVNSCRQNRELALQFMRENGEITGRPSAEQAVMEWQAAHPNGRKADCIRDTGLSKPTVYRWWKEEA